MLACLFGVFTFNSALADVDVANIPLSLSADAPPNLMFIIDDSGSMNFEFIPDSINDYSSAPRTRPCWGCSYQRLGENVTYQYYYSPKVNFSYYDPDVTYEPPFKPDGSGRMNPSSYTSAWEDGYAKTGSINLSNSFQIRWADLNNDYTGINNQGSYSFDNGGFYYKYAPSAGDLASCDGDPEQNKCYQYVSINNASEDEKQNFANWYSYYRSRLFAARASIGEAFDSLSPVVRLGWGAINLHSNGTTVDGASNLRAVTQGVRSYDDSYRTTFYNWLYSKSASGSTPLRRALEGAGRYFEQSSAAWSNDPDNPSSNEMLECRQSFTILMTDGLWSGSDPIYASGNVDDTDGPLITNPDGADYQYKKGTEPFSDDQSSTLADVAMHYWKRDLRSDMENRVPVSARNPAFWQHMVTYGVGFGVEGTQGITPELAFNAIATGDNVGWGSTSTAKGKIDDLLHAAVNSRGGSFNASDPKTLSTELAGLLSDIVGRVEQSTTSAAASSAVFRQGALAYSAGFRSTDWSGAVQAAQIMTGGGRGKLIWDAERQLHMMVENTGHGARNLYTNDGSGGVALNSLSSLSATQQAALNTALDGTNDGLGADRIDWLRGDNSANGSFRDREFQPEGSTQTFLRLIGDIIGSNPQYAGKTNFGYRRLPGTEGSSYGVFRASQDYRDRPDIIYVGANDGFLHAFHSLTGEELFAYMPGHFLEPEDGNSHAAINELMDPQYDHRYYVDGTPAITDAYIDGQWRTILVGTTGVGGKTVFALDVTDPESFSASDVLWEFTHDELGYGVSDASIVRLTNGTWAAVFGNGYNSNSHGSSLFVLNLENGNLIQRISAGTGTDAEPNGMSAPVVMADRTEGNAIRAYAGDLQGNLWRFDLDAGTMTSTLLFEATDDNDDPQPITAAPKLAYVPQGSNSEVMVVFGTGSYFRVSDSGDNQYQSLYGIADDGTKSNLDRDNLQGQTITESTKSYIVQADGSTETQTMDVRTLSDNPLGNTDDGWVVDLDTVSGERVVSPAAFPSGYPVTRVRFSTLIPENNGCSSGMDGYLMDIDLVTGGKTQNTVFDLNRDGEFDAGDAAAGSQIVNGVRNVVAGERISVILGNGTDIFLDSELVPVPDDYDGHEEVDEEGEGDTGSGGGGGGGGGGDDCDADALFCGDAEGFRFGRQNWEELR